MGLKDIVDRIDSRLAALGISATAASSRAGITRDAIRNMRRAVQSDRTSGVSTNTLEALAPVLETTASWLLDGSGDEYVETKLRRVTINSQVQAGLWEENPQWEDHDLWYDVAVPAEAEFKNYNLFGTECRGPSMNRRYPDGTPLVYTSIYETEERPTPGKRYIVERERSDGMRESTVKTLHRDDDGELWLVPESDDPRFQQPIKLDGENGDTVRIVGRVVYAVHKE